MQYINTIFIAKHFFLFIVRHISHNYDNNDDSLSIICLAISIEKGKKEDKWGKGKVKVKGKNLTFFPKLSFNSHIFSSSPISFDSF